jgi:ATP-dependent DNA helicase RecG
MHGMTMAIRLDTPIQFVKGVGPQRARMFETAGIHIVEDLLKYRPLRYEDRTNFRAISDLRTGQTAVVKGSVVGSGSYTTRRKGFSILETVVADQSGGILIKFFNQPYLSRILQQGRTVIVFGQPEFDSFSGRIAFLNPDFEILEPGDIAVHTGRVVPVYRRVGKLSSKIIRQILFHILSSLPDEIEDPVPESIRCRFNFPTRAEAFSRLHFPLTRDDVPRDQFLEMLLANQTPAHHRFIFEEFFLFQFGLFVLRGQRQLKAKRRRIQVTDRVRERVKSILPFHPTDAQKRVIKEIVDDLRSSRVMHRLLQGDVGSGKTIVAVQAMLLVMEHGYQTALMAPTELLAEQHFREVKKLLGGQPCEIVFLSSKVKGKERKNVLQKISEGQAQLVIGTHALIQKGVSFRKLGLVVVDEQHRFGVLQRSELMKKGEQADTLVMTATPIPRSLALTAYGDLDVSVIDELPPGRKPVRTVVKTEQGRQEVYHELNRQLAQGRQIYVVYPLIEESEKLDLKTATEGAEILRSVFPDREVGLMHGKLAADEKDSLMKRFVAGEILILVSTTVIEVGIDVPNATVMVIEHAERFGLSQLHQLRGRVGRGEHGGLCVLMVDVVKTPEAFQRLDIMRRTNDGFQIAEKDLEIRGPGEFVGTRQSGVPEFLFGNIVRDRDWLELARREAEKHVSNLVNTDDPGSLERCRTLLEKWQHRYGLFQVG